MISKDEVKHIAKLARLELTETEISKMQTDLSSILDYFDILKKAPKVAESKKEKGILRNNLRRDEALPRPASLAGNLVAGAPAKQGDYIKVKSIL